MFRPSFFLSNDWAFCTLSLLTVYTIPILFHCHLVLLSSGCDQSFILIKVALFITNYSWLERISEVKYRKVNLKGSFNIFQYFEGEQKQNCYRLKSQCMKPAQSLATVRQTPRQAKGVGRKTRGVVNKCLYGQARGVLNKCLHVYRQALPRGSTPHTLNYVPFFTKKAPLSNTFY